MDESSKYLTKLSDSQLSLHAPWHDNLQYNNNTKKDNILVFLLSVTGRTSFGAKSQDNQVQLSSQLDTISKTQTELLLLAFLAA